MTVDSGERLEMVNLYSKRLRVTLIPTLTALGLFVSASTRAATPENYTLRSTADLVTICSGDASQELGFCQGFTVGVFRVLQEVQTAKPSARFFCMPLDPPSRTEIIHEYVAWAQGTPSELTRTPPESIASFLAQRFPCVGHPG